MLKISLSVHDIVDVILRKGHLDNRVFNRSSMLEGTRLHSLYQGEQGSDYIAEYPLHYAFSVGEYCFDVEGKADGVFINKNNDVTVEEIKTTVEDLDEFIKDHGEWHLGQALFYAYMIAKEKNKESIKVVMTYLKQSNYKIRKHIENVYSMKELENFTRDVLLRYARYMDKIYRFKKERDESVISLAFPFQNLRKGQQELMDFVKISSEQKKIVFVEAPTGTGKTISVLYPLVKRFRQGKVNRIYYLTNKNSIKKIAMKTLEIFDRTGCKLKGIELTAKENICFNDKKGHCNPVECPFAKNYYDKLLEAIFDALNLHNLFHRDTIEALCFEKKMCPYQFQLDLANYCDVQVCDYSYVFDYHDRTGLEENGMKGSHSLLCVDECHNLPDRVRDMYSERLDTHELSDALSLCSGLEFQSLKSSINDLIDSILKRKFDPECEDVKKNHLFIETSVPQTIENSMNDIITCIKELIRKHPQLVTDPLLEFFYKINNCYYLASLMDEEELNPCFLFYYEIRDNEIQALRIANLNSTPLIKMGTDLFDSTVFFSATLSPKDYYIDLLGGDSNDTSTRLVLPSPFPESNRRVFVNSRISLLYKDRERTLYDVYCTIKTAVSAKQGNYFVFCPSFEYMKGLKNFFEQDPIDNTEVIYQGHYMDEETRRDFLEHFTFGNKKTVVGVLVLGGIFSEGIDLVGDRLIGSIVISVGLPQIGFERDRLKDYYDGKGTVGDSQDSQHGFKYAYTYPGINKVLQAAGRVIRTENDKGFMLFVDSRYRYSLYRDILKEVYPDYINLYSNAQLKKELLEFWKEKQK